MRRARLLATLMALFFCIARAHGATFVVPPDEWMIDDASAIVAGVVTDSFPRWTASGDIETVFVVAVDEVLKGKLSTKRVEVVEWGGRFGDRWMAASGAPRYELGKRYLIFLTENRNREWSTQHLTLGRFQFIHSDAGDLLARDGFEIHGWDIQGNPPLENERFSQGFLSFIRGRVGGLNARADYFVDRVVRPSPVRGSEAQRRIASNFAAYDFADASAVGVGSWVDESGSNVAYSVSGSAATGDGVNVSDGEERIIEEDPNDLIAGAFTGSGVVARAFYGGSGSHEFEGQQYVTLSGSDIVTQNGVKASNLGQSTLRTAMVHEVGHTLGFRHSNQDADGGVCALPLPCTTSAAMNSSVGPTNGALQGWDIDAAQATYGGGGTASDYTLSFCSEPGCNTRRANTSVAFHLAQDVCTPPSITTHPANKTITPPATSASLSVTATGSTPFSYQWYVGNSGDTSAPTGTNSSSITVSPIATTNYWVRVTGQCAPTKDSNTAIVTVAPCAPPVISSQSNNTSIIEGTSTQLTVNATGTSLHYQWYIGSPGNTSQPTGTDNKNLTVSPTTTTTYWVRVSGACEPAEDSAGIVVTVEPCGEIIIGTPTATISGASAILNITASSTASGALSYAWFRGNTPGGVGTQVGSTKSVTVAVTADVRNYWVRVTNSCNGVAISGLVAVASCTLPVIQTQPVDQSILTGTSTNVSLALPANATGITVTWYRGTAPDKTNQIGTGTTVPVGPLTATTSYWASLRNTCGEISSRTAVITVTAPTCTAPTITTAPLTQQVPINTPASLLVVADGTATLLYQWYEGAKSDTTKPIENATLPTFVSRRILSATSFWVRVTNGCGTIDSEAAVITVPPGRRRAAAHR